MKTGINSIFILLLTLSSCDKGTGTEAFNFDAG